MNKPYIYILLLASMFTACKKDKENSASTPVANFSIANDKSESVIVNQDNSVALDNTSTGATTYLWDFGNGLTSTDARPAIILQPGSYTVLLTAKNASGLSSTTKKQIKVVAPTVKDIVIKQMDWTQKMVKNIPDFKTADIWVEILKKETDINYPVLPNGVSDAPLLYKSKVYKNATIKSAPIDLQVDEQIKLVKYTEKGVPIKYTVSLYAKDATGTTYLLHSTDTGSGTGEFFENVKSSYFFWDTGTFDGCHIDITGTEE